MTSHGEIIQAAAEAMTAFWESRGGHRLAIAEAESVVAAVGPLIRAQIADGIAEDRSSNDFMSRFYDEYAYEANRRAERVARGGS